MKVLPVWIADSFREKNVIEPAPGKKSSEKALEQTSQRSGGITVSGSVQKPRTCGAQRHGLVLDLTVLG